MASTSHGTPQFLSKFTVKVLPSLISANAWLYFVVRHRKGMPVGKAGRQQPIFAFA
jgi:hypothetical protein